MKDTHLKYPCDCQFEYDHSLPLVNGKPSIIFDPENVNENCEATWDLICSGSTLGIFQLESNLGQHYSKKLKPRTMEHLSALAALLRPGTLNSKNDDGVSMTDLYCQRKNGIQEVTYDIEALKPILDSTYGIMTYQEEIIQVARDLAGFTESEGDTLRKCVTKDTMFVSKTRGWISIKKLLEDGYQDDLFLVMNERGEQQWKKLNKIWSNGIHNVSTVETASGFSVRATHYHQFLTSKGWKARKRLKDEEDYMVCARKIDYDGEDLISQNMAMVVAGIIAEGTFQFTKKNQRVSQFTNFDSFMMGTFIHHFEQEFGVGNFWHSEDKKVVRIRVEEQEKLAKYISRGKSDSRKLPQVMMGMTKSTTAKFLSYLLACEGGITKETGNFEFSSKSPIFAKQIKFLLMRFGIRSNLISNYDNERHRLYINDFVDQKILIRELTSYWPENKKQQLKEVVEKKEGNFTTDIFPTEITTKLIDQYPFVGNGESGTLYTANISRKRFTRIANITKDKYWIDLANGCQSYELLKSTQKITKEVETFDFTVEGGETPYIIANGMVIHNSMGKKDTQLMAKVRTQFIEKATTFGVITKEESEKLFDNIEKSQKYLFNKSHSWAYAIMGYRTAYMKAHFPIQFFTSYLYYAKDKMDPTLEVRRLINDAKSFGIEVLPPRFSTMPKRFKTNGVDIQFGLSNVAGIGEKIVDKMRAQAVLAEETLGKPKATWSWYDFLFYFSDNCNSKAVVNMISVGGLSDLKLDRRKLLHEYNIWSELSPGEKKKIVELTRGVKVESLSHVIGSLLLLPKGVLARRREKVVSLKKLLDTPPSSLQDSPAFLAKAEEENLGIAITCNKVDAAAKSDHNLMTCHQFKNGYGDRDLVMAVEITDYKEFRVKNGDNRGKKMAKLTLADASGSLEAVCFSKAYENCGSLLYVGNTLEVAGNRNDDGGFRVESATQI